MKEEIKGRHTKHVYQNTGHYLKLTCAARWIFRRFVEKGTTDMDLCWICGPIRQICLTMTSVIRSKGSGVVKLAPEGIDQGMLFLGRKSEQVFELESLCPKGPTEELDLGCFLSRKDFQGSFGIRIGVGSLVAMIC